MTFGLVTDPVGHAPVRRVNSVRRTSSLDSTWPDGQDGMLHMEGRCRDVATGAELGSMEELRSDRMLAQLDDNRTIRAVECDRLDLSPLVGARGGGHLRAALEEKIPDELAQGSPLYLVLDDISGASLVSGWAWSRWMGDDFEEDMKSGFEERRKFMENVCHGFATGNSALATDRPPRNNPEVVPLQNPQDDESWHDLPEVNGANFRRARRIDVWREDDAILIDVGFQDSASDPSGGRVAIHEYCLQAKADASSGVITELAATPHILPFPECPGAVANIQVLVGMPIREMRHRVIDELPGVKGCTHLNDLLRGLAEAPVLASFLAD